MKRNSKKGFTLAELLIVVAIIAVLIAIMFPVFGAQLDKARAAAELANVRAQYSELVATKMLGEGDSLTTDPVFEIEISQAELEAAKQYGDKTVIALDNDAHTVTVTYNGKYNGTFKVDEDVTLKSA